MTAAEVVARLEEAGRVLISIPNEGTRKLQATPPEVRHALEGCKAGPQGEPASLLQIARMNEALGWVSLIPRDRYVLRCIVGARCLVNPTTGKHVYSWRRLATLLGADAKAVQRWHAQGIVLIAAAMTAAAGGPRDE